MSKSHFTSDQADTACEGSRIEDGAERKLEKRYLSLLERGKLVVDRLTEIRSNGLS